MYWTQIYCDPLILMSEICLRRFLHTLFHNFQQKELGPVYARFWLNKYFKQPMDPATALWFEANTLVRSKFRNVGILKCVTFKSCFWRPLESPKIPVISYLSTIALSLAVFICIHDSKFLDYFKWLIIIHHQIIHWHPLIPFLLRQN